MTNVRKISKKNLLKNEKRKQHRKKDWSVNHAGGLAQKHLKKFAGRTTIVNLVRNFLMIIELLAAVGTRLLEINRTLIYYKENAISEEKLAIKAIMDPLHIDHLTWGSR